MKAMEDKIKQVIEACERICPEGTPIVSLGNGLWLSYGIVGRWTIQFEEHGSKWILANLNIGKENSESIIHIFHSLLSLGVQSPAPDEKDENGLLPCAHCGGKADAYDGKLHFTIKCFSCYMTIHGFVEHEVRKKWNTRAHAPIAGKDHEIDRLKAQGDEFIAQRNHLQSLLKAEREKSARLIGALEEIKKVASTEAGLSMDTLIGYIDGRLAAYKGKEAKEGGEG